MKMILFGSRAIKYHYPDFPRECNDWDFLVDEEYRYLRSELEKVEYKYIEPLWKILTPKEESTGVLLPYKLLTLKMSHLFYDNNWEKHMEDVQFLLKKGCIPSRSLFEELFAWWQKVLPKKQRRSNLKQNKEVFFKNKINYVIDHDFIHTLINPFPAYQRILLEGSEVEPSEELWWLQPRTVKFNIIQEEVMVMAWERGRKHDYREAYQWMLKKFIMQHAPIWEMIYIVENYEELKDAPFDYIKKINDGLSRAGISYDREENDGERVSQTPVGELQLA